MWVKICANTSLADTLRAAELGADAVGFVFAPSRRQVTAAQVAAITPHLPAGVERVGVFDSPDAATIERTVIDAGLTAVQLHNELDLELLSEISGRLGPEIGIIQTLHWRTGDAAGPGTSPAQFAAAVEAARGAMRHRPLRILVDSKTGTASGGTGVTFDWHAAAQVFRAAQAGEVRLIAAGGLNPENVAAAIQRLGPWGVDVASGVESAPGRKDPTRLETFINRAHEGQNPLSRVL